MRRLSQEVLQNLSHELRTPLTLVLGYVEALDAGLLGPLTDEQQQALRTVLAHTHRLHTLIERLLTLQSVTLNANELFRVPIELDAVIKPVVTKWRELATSEGVNIEVEVTSPEPRVLGDPTLLAQMVDILVENAVKFSIVACEPAGNRSAPGTPAPRTSARIGIRAWMEGGDVRLAIADNGIGIPIDDLQRVFAPFYQADRGTTRQYGGLGIGLTLCQAIVEAHGGRIWAESEGPGKGSTFHVALPHAATLRARVSRPRAASHTPARDHLYSILAR